MSRSKKLYILLGVFVVACIATLAVTQIAEHKEQIKNSGEPILELSSDSVQALSWEHKGETLAFHRDETWLYDGDEKFPVSEDKINELLEQFQPLSAAFVIEGVEDYGQYGLDNPVCTIHLTTEEQSYEIKLGDFSKMDSQRYVSIGDGNVYLVQNDPLDQFDAVLSDMIAHDEMPDFDQVTSIQFSGAQDYAVSYEEDSSNTYCAEDVYFTQRGEKSLPLDTERVGSYLRKISNLNPTNYVTYNVTDEELATYGLDTPELTVTVEYTPKDEETAEVFILHISRDPEEIKKPSDEDDGGDETVTAYLRADQSQIIYQRKPQKILGKLLHSLRNVYTNVKKQFSPASLAMKQPPGKIIDRQAAAFSRPHQPVEQGEDFHFRSFAFLNQLAAFDFRAHFVQFNQPLLYGLNFLLGQYRTTLNQFAIVNPAAAVHAIIRKLLEGNIQINTQLDGVYHRDLLQAVVAVAAAGVNVGRAQNTQRIIVTKGFDVNASLL